MCVWVVVVRMFEMRALARKRAEIEGIVGEEGSEQDMTAVRVGADSKA
jgi:ACS family pantothenate transporter-like MFS transporter